MEIRDATADDYLAYVPLFAELGIDDPVPSRDRFTDEIVPRMIVATDGDGVVGYALYERLADVGYIRNLVADPTRRRQGIGAALMDALRRRFVDAGATAWCLNVRPDNAAAIALYRRCGLRRMYGSYALRLPRSVTLAAPPDDVELVPVVPADDAAVEDTLHLIRGQLASARARASRQVLQLRRAGAIVGVAVLAPAIPDAFPFRVVDPALGPALAALLRDHAPGSPFLQLGVEDDDALRDGLLALGAYLHVEIEHMRGPLSA
jgi:GNAT superfamily N-acetyltransferase